MYYEGELVESVPMTGQVGATSLALLAFLADGSTTRHGRYRPAVKRAVKWLGQQQDAGTGFIGHDAEEHSAIHHAMACLALADNYYDSRNPFQKRLASRALQCIERSQKLDGGWHQEYFCKESMETLLAGWNLLAITAGAEAGLCRDHVTIDIGLTWLQANTDSATGRIGPDPIADMHWSNDAELRSNIRFSTTFIRAGWFAQITADRPLGQPALVQTQADKALKDLPAWRPDGLVDWQGWYFGTQLMFQVGGEPWKHWHQALVSTLPSHQSVGENLHGSWPPGLVGGRIQSTAYALLALQVPYRHKRLIELETER